MCWSGEASATLALGGFAGAAYFYRKGEPKELCAALAYFSGMEALQAYTYTVINQCSNPDNQVATLLGYLHIAFQPIFINAVSMQFIPQRVRKKIQYFVYALCFVASWFWIMRLYPFTWARPCWQVQYSLPFLTSYHPNVPFCGKIICSLHGQWHIAWEIPARFVFLFDNAYVWTAFLLPILYGSWRITIYHILTGPFLAYLTTNNANEWAAVWCLYSIGLLGVMIKTPVRRTLHVKRWFWWGLLPDKRAGHPLAPSEPASSNAGN